MTELVMIQRKIMAAREYGVDPAAIIVHPDHLKALLNEAGNVIDLRPNKASAHRVKMFNIPFIETEEVVCGEVLVAFR